jgi:hypothetical protein
MLKISGNVQVPWLHAPPTSQALAQAPQFIGSLETSTQRPPQGSVSIAQMQKPSSQLRPPMHCVPHEPQLSESVLRSTQRPLHALQPAGHGS